MSNPEHKERLDSPYKLILFNLADILVQIWQVKSILRSFSKDKCVNKGFINLYFGKYFF